MQTHGEYTMYGHFFFLKRKRSTRIHTQGLANTFFI
jgi:hypothetical protein